MKLCRYDDNKIGLVRGRNLHDVTAILDALPPLRYPVAFGDHLIANLDKLRPRMEALADKAAAQPVDKARFLSPVANPSKIIGTPANYHAHVEEARRDAEIAVYSAGKQRTIEEQGLFLKASSSLVGPSEGVAIRFPDRRTDHEAELGVVIGRKTGFVPETDALSVWPAMRSRSTWWCAARRIAASASRPTAMRCSGPGWSPPTSWAIRARSTFRSPSTARSGRPPIRAR
jgi:2,4-diketo-3-deoxy-L-fuconate hydrolase